MYRRAVLLANLQTMALQVIDLKDPYASMHSHRVSVTAARLARAMGLRRKEVERIRIGGLVHDIGIIGVEDYIVRRKPEEQLTPEEQASMRQHASVGAYLIKDLAILGASAEMVLHHHENYDGSGYPDGLEGEKIPLGSRVIAVADEFDLLVTDRPYRKAVSLKEALAVIREHAGTQFDPTIVAVFERMIMADTGIVPQRS